MAQKALAYGLSIVALREVAFCYQFVIEKSLYYGLGDVSHREVRGELIRTIKAGGSSVRENATGDILLATKEALDLD